MPCHIWGDDWPHWKELYEAQDFIYEHTYRWSRCRLSSKEKYGTIRYEYVFPPYTVTWSKSPLQHYWMNSRLAGLWANFGWYMCGRAIKKAIKRWPHLEDELCEDFCYGKFGAKCEAKYWKRVD